MFSSVFVFSSVPVYKFIRLFALLFLIFGAMIISIVYSA